MHRKLNNSVLFVVLLFFVVISRAKDIKEVLFDIQKPSTFTCKPTELYLEVGELFQITVKYGKQFIYGIARCNEYQNVELKYKYKKQRYESVQNFIFEKREDLQYKCVFFIRKCDPYVNYTCWYKSWGWPYADEGVVCKTTIYVREKPNGYLLLNNNNFTRSSVEHVYKFRNGERVNLTCHLTAGEDIQLMYIWRDIKNPNITALKCNSTCEVGFNFELGVENNDSTIQCITANIMSGKATISLKLLMIDEENQEELRNQNGVLAIWTTFVLLLAISLFVGIFFFYKQKKNKQLLRNNSTLIVYNNRLSSQSSETNTHNTQNIETDHNNIYSNIPKRDKEQSNEEHTYLNSGQLKELTSIQNDEPCIASIQTDDLPYTSIKNDDPTHETVQKQGQNKVLENKEVPYAELQLKEPNAAHQRVILQDLTPYATIQFEPIYTSIENDDPSTSTEPTYVNHSSIKAHQNTNQNTIKHKKQS